MGAESEELRLSVQYRLTKIEQIAAQLVLDHASLHNTVAELRKIIGVLQNFRVRSETRMEDAQTRSTKLLAWIGAITVIAHAVIEVLFKMWTTH